ncbi:MAG: methyltransferase domain-containing protein [Candidatus Zipacnadales bacterium]
MVTYCVSVLGGLENIAGAEIRERLPGAVVRDTVVRSDRGRIYFDYAGPPNDVLTLRSVEHVFIAVTEFEGLPSDEKALDIIRAHLASCDFTLALKVHAQLNGPIPDPTFHCTSKRIGAHAYRSQQVMAAAGAGVVDHYGWRVNLKRYDYDIHVDVDHDRCTVALKLTPQSLHYRGRVAHGPASLNPTLGYAMSVLSGPQPHEVFVDPTCGAGTVIIERAALGPARLLAGDLFEKPIEMARANFSMHRLEVALLRWDARRLPLASESVDKFCANLPWGRRAGSHTVNKHLYPGLVREIARTLKKGGLAVLLSLEKQLLQRLLKRPGWLRIEAIHAVSVGGLKPSIYVVRKWRGRDQ